MGGDGRLTDEPRIKVSSKERWLTANNFQHSRGLIKESNGNERKNTETPALDGKTNRKQMVGRGVHFLWRGSFTRRIISDCSCNLSRKNETQGKTKPKIMCGPC